MNCPQCNTIVPESSRNCPACETHAGFPNVRAAEKPDNVEALKRRVKEAEISTGARKCDTILKEFGDAVCSSKAVLCRSLSKITSLMKSDNELINTYYQQIRSRQRLPEDNVYDNSRGAADAKLFPNYHEEIRFAVLVLNDEVLEHYGNCGLVLEEKVIQERATVFEENTLVFFEKHRITMAQPIPNGYRAVWKDRNMLAMAKLHYKIDSTKTKDDFPGILFPKSHQDGINDDFIEVHIYGTIHRKSVEYVIAKSPRERCDRTILESLKRSLEKDGISLKITT